MHVGQVAERSHWEEPGAEPGQSRTLITEMAQIAVCNRHHSVDPQFVAVAAEPGPARDARPLHDAGVGVRREGVTELAGKLQEPN